MAKSINIETMKKNRKLAKSIGYFKAGRTIHVRDMMQTYSYTLVENPGKGFQDDFKPYFTPEEMLKMGVFEGKYMNDCILEFPRSWYSNMSKFALEGADPAINYFGIKSRLSLGEWMRRGWIPCHVKDKDIRGWFQWYCRYWLGRRVPEVDEIQIGRWKKFKRHFAQVEKNAKGNLSKRRRQRQALLQWSWNCFI